MTWAFEYSFEIILSHTHDIMTFMTLCKLTTWASHSFYSTANYTSAHISEFTNAEPWLPESGVISVPFSLNMNVPPGVYEMLLELADPLLTGNPDYNIILLNENIAELATGLNHLGHNITVSIYLWFYVWL